MNRVIAILDTREGIGQNVISLSVGLTTAIQTGDECALINLNFDSYQTFPIFLGVKPEKSIQDLFNVIDKLDSKMAKGFFTKYRNNFYFLDLPSTSILHPRIDKISLLVSFLREIFKFSFVMVERKITERTMALLDGSDFLLIITSPHLLSINDARKVIEDLKKQHYPLDFCSLVINMADIKGGIPVKTIKETLGVNVVSEIPFDPLVITSINEGILPIEKYPHSSFSRAIKKLGNFLIEEDQKEEKESIFKWASIKLEQRVKERKEEQAEEKKEEVTELSPEEAKIALKKKIHQRLLEEFDLKEWNIHTQDESQKQALYKRVRGIIENLIAEEASLPLNRDERSEVVTELVDEVLGLGPLEKFLRDETISEIMVNGPQKIYIEKAGKIYLTDARFTSTEQLMTVIDRILSPIGRRVDESSPLVDARLPDGSRVNVIIPPLSLIGPVITIRKFVAKRLDMDDLVRLGSLTREMVEFLRVCVILRKNILVSGGTGSGKTTLLNMLSSFIPEDERIVTIEDSAELRLRQEHVISLESKPPNIEGKGAIPIRRLVINALRMRPDRIVVGECRGGEALDMLQAMNTGHDGSLTTIHANSPKDAISRLTTMVLMAGTELPERAIREQIASAINIIVQTARLKDGSRKVVKISEVIPLEAGEMKIQDLFYFEQLGYDENKKVVGRFRKCGVLPTFFDEIKIMGLELSEDIFKDEVKV